ncbi:actin [Holotrichia oblita]|uniref:Actin n=1 Tax=Holotrichia oblita TaxID=644536 RepID=A0ACB9SSM9_HOLOL|nr:actin [Holotrichia oblita]
MLLSIMLTVSFILVDCKIRKRHVSNSIEPQQVEEIYDLSGWISSLHLQQCVFIAIGENFFAIFLEKVPRPFDEDQEIKDYFIGICDLENLAKWKLCPVPVELKRPEDCKFEKSTQRSARVHRRLCDLSELTSFASHCSCDGLLRGEKLFNVVGNCRVDNS